MESPDQKYLERCLELARSAAERGEVPVGALIVDNTTGEVLAEASNQRESQQSPIGHAEILAIMEACKKKKSWRLLDCTLYSSLEPCVMCSGAILQARIPRVVYSAKDEKGGGQSLFGLFDCLKLNHRAQWEQGRLEEDNRLLLQDFFKKKRKLPSS